MATSTDELAEAFRQSKDERDFAKLYKIIKPGLTAHVRKIVRDPAGTDDVVSNAFTNMWSKIDQYDSRWAFSTWAYNIASNAARQYVNSRKREKITKDFETSMKYMVAPEAPDESELEDRELLAAKVIDMIDMLPERYKEIFRDREICHMKYQDLADKYGCSINTVKTRVMRAREAMADLMNVKREVGLLSSPAREARNIKNRKEAWLRKKQKIASEQPFPTEPTKSPSTGRSTGTRG